MAGDIFGCHSLEKQRGGPLPARDIAKHSSVLQYTGQLPSCHHPHPTPNKELLCPVGPGLRYPTKVCNIHSLTCKGLLLAHFLDRELWLKESWKITQSVEPKLLSTALLVKEKGGDGDGCTKQWQQPTDPGSRRSLGESKSAQKGEPIY